MRDETIYFYKHKQGYNCSQCLLKAYENKFGVQVSSQCYAMLRCVNTGFGIGVFCSLLISAITIFGIENDEVKAKKMRLEFLEKFKAKYPSFNCSVLIGRREKGKGCEDLIGDVAGMVEEILVNNGN